MVKSMSVWLSVANDRCSGVFSEPVGLSPFRKFYQLSQLKRREVMDTSDEKGKMVQVVNGGRRHGVSLGWGHLWR